MKKKIYVSFFLIVFFSIVYLSSKGDRYIGVNYVVKIQKISNFQKLSDFYERHINYKKLVKEITYKSKNQQERIIDISTWVYKNIKKITNKDNVIDNHPWTIVEREIGTDDQFSDILSVLLVHDSVDSFFINKTDNTSHPITFFRYDEEWSIIDPYYGVYFTNTKKKISSIEEIKNNDSVIQHLVFDKITSNNLNKIFFDKNFKNIQELNSYYKILLLNLPSSKIINNNNIYERGGRSYVQKPLHRILFQLKTLLKI
jgi:hypothetical protein